MGPAIHIVPVGPGVPIGLLDDLSAVLARVFRVSCRVRIESEVDAEFAYDSQRGQYHATSLLRRMRELVPDDEVRVIGVTRLDLFVPILTFVFGEAESGGRCAVVSLQRLDERHYAFPARQDLLSERLIKEAIHELGHTFGLRHCDDWRCVMTSSHGIERLDVKGWEFCRKCRVGVAGC